MHAIVQPANPLRVVVADDDAEARLDLVRVLATDPERQVVAEATDGASLVELVLLHPTDLVLFDVHLPGMNGFEALKRIREVKAVIAVVLTADPSPDLVQKAIREQVHGYLLKPVSPPQLGASLLLARSAFDELTRLQVETGRLNKALESRKLVERAKGVLMKRHRWGEAEAFRRLQRAAMNRRTTMAELARLVLDGVPVEL